MAKEDPTIAKRLSPVGTVYNEHSDVAVIVARAQTAKQLKGKKTKISS